MKVMCIKEGNWKDLDRGLNNSFAPKYGEFCTVIDNFSCRHGALYVLKEYHTDSDLNVHYFLAKFFIVCSDIDELELVNEKESVNA